MVKKRLTRVLFLNPRRRSRLTPKQEQALKETFGVKVNIGAVLLKKPKVSKKIK